jgi:hypothetical protein
MTARDLPRAARALLLLAAAVAASATAIAVAAPVAGAAGRPPLPAGAVQIAPGHVPAVCSGTFDAYNVNYGYYWSTASKAWVQAPRCYPRWGFLSASASQVVRAGRQVTVTATPDGGSNSGTYAPEARAISWTYPGRRVAGCGAADLSCTVIPAAKAAREWQWGLFHVAMPRTFFVDFPSEFCAGQHLCAGVTTQAWSYAGVPPKGAELPVTVSGVVRRGCGAGACSALPIRGAEVTATSSKGKRTTRSGGDGDFSFKLKPGRWTLRTRVRGVEIAPQTRSVTVSKRDVGGQDFRGCLAGIPAGRAAARAAQQEPLVLVATVKRACGAATREDLSSTITVRYLPMRSKIGSVRWAGSAWCMSNSAGGSDYGLTFSLATRPASPITERYEHGVRTFSAPYSYLDNGRDYVGRVDGYLSPADQPKKGKVNSATVDFPVGSSATCTASASEIELKPAM